MTKDSVFHRHSTLFAVSATAITVVAVGQLSRWNPIWMVISGVVAIVVLPRFFYGFEETRAMEAEPVPDDSIYGTPYDRWTGERSESGRIFEAYEKAQGHGFPIAGIPDDSDLRHLAEEQGERP